MERISLWLNRHSMYLALLTAWTALCGSLYFSEVRGYVPCVLCWYQRILMYPLSVVIAVGLLRRDPHLPYYVLPLSLYGLGMSTYHYLLEKTDLFVGAAACTQGVACTTQWINWFGFVTIPFLALVAFLIVTLMSVIALLQGEPAAEDAAGSSSRAPWLPVGGVWRLCWGSLPCCFSTGRRFLLRLSSPAPFRRWCWLCRRPKRSRWVQGCAVNSSTCRPVLPATVSTGRGWRIWATRCGALTVWLVPRMPTCWRSLVRAGS